jgi:uncharacterized protein (DUF488 family)
MGRWARSTRIYALGHSTRPLSELVELLRAHGVTALADIRTVPRSRANPQFNRDALERELPLAGIHYEHLARLGGLRHSKLGARSPNAGWRNASFRAFADYMQTRDFTRGLGDLHLLARESPVALLCAEAVPWRCHRSLVADALWARGVVVQHIWSRTRTTAHELTPFARRRGLRLTYPPVR